MKKSRLEIKPIRRNLSRVLDSARNGNLESMLKLGKHYSYLKFVDERLTIKSQEVGKKKFPYR